MNAFLTQLLKKILRKKVIPKSIGHPNFLGGSNLGGNLGDNNEK